MGDTIYPTDLVLSKLSNMGLDGLLKEAVYTIKCELTSLRIELDKAKRALVRAGFEDLGGMEWKPPLNETNGDLWQKIFKLKEELLIERASLKRTRRALDIFIDSYMVEACKQCERECIGGDLCRQLLYVSAMKEA